MERALVSDEAGFIDSHLCTRFVSKGHDVICSGNFLTGSKDNIGHLMENHHFGVVRHDATYPYSTEVDEIYNLACPVSLIHYQHDPIQAAKTSAMGAIDMLGLAMKLDTKILQTSTSEVYGNPVIHPQPESYWGSVNPVGYRSCYDEGRRYAGTLFMDYCHQNRTRIKTIRIFDAYGPGMLPDDGRVVSNFIIQALNNKDITIYGDGKRTRSFQHIDDLMEGVVRMMNTEDDFTGPINIGNPNESPTFELAERVIRITGSTSKIIFKPLPTDDPKQHQPDIRLAKKKLGQQPTVELEDGLKHVIEYLKDV